MVVTLFSTQGCQLNAPAKNHFTLAQDSCFKNALKPNPKIIFTMARRNGGYQFPFVKNSLLHMHGVRSMNDSMAFLSRNKEIRITSWGNINYNKNITNLSQKDEGIRI